MFAKTSLVAEPLAKARC